MKIGEFAGATGTQIETKDAGHCGILNGLSNASRSTAPRPASHLAQVHGVPAKHRSRTSKQALRRTR